MPSTRSLVLIADDDEDDRYLAKLAMERIPLPVDLHFAADGQELVDYLSDSDDYRFVPKRVPSLILLDIKMPVKNGYEALDEIKFMRRHAHIPIVMWTTSSDPQDKKELMRRGAAEFVTKPSTLDGFTDSLQRVVRQWAYGGHLQGQWLGASR